MTYSLGLDLGTTNSAAAIADEQGVRMLSIGHDSPLVASVIHITIDGAITFGRAAVRRAESDPAGVAREFKRRFGDTTPLLLHGTPVAANDLTLWMATHLVSAATELQGEAPSELVVCHPANWGAFKTSLLDDTLDNSPLPPHRLISEPEAAAVHYASQERVVDGTTVAVYDLGGGTFDVAILRKTAGGWERIGRPGGIERLGGIDFDTAIFQHVVGALDLDLDAFDDDDLAVRAAVARLRADCTEAKHALSADTSATISVLLPGRSEQVRITRSEFEALIGPAITRSIETFDNTLAASDLSYNEVDRILMVGGSSRIPLVAQRVASHTGRPLATDAHPKHSCALGAATFASVANTSEAAAAPPASEPVHPPAAAPFTPMPSGEVSADDEVNIRQPLGGMFQELPHISEGLPDFMDRGRGRQASPTPLDVPSVTPPATPPPRAAGPPTFQPAAPPVIAAAARASAGNLPATQANPVLVPTDIYAPSQGRPSPTVQKRRRTGSASMFLIGMLLVVGLGGAAAYALGVFDPLTGDSASGGSGTTITTSVPGTEGGVVNATNCPNDRIPDPAIAYQIKEIAADDKDGGANARIGPGLGADSPPVTVLPSFTPLDLDLTKCELDADGRAWWGVNIDGGLLWVSSNLIVPAG